MSIRRGPIPISDCVLRFVTSANTTPIRSRQSQRTPNARLSTTAIRTTVAIPCIRIVVLDGTRTVMATAIVGRWEGRRRSHCELGAKQQASVAPSSILCFAPGEPYLQHSPKQLLKVLRSRSLVPFRSCMPVNTLAFANKWSLTKHVLGFLASRAYECSQLCCYIDVTIVGDA